MLSRNLLGLLLVLVGMFPTAAKADSCSAERQLLTNAPKVALALRTGATYATDEYRATVASHYDILRRFLTAAYLEDRATLDGLRRELAECSGGTVQHERMSWSALALRLGVEPASEIAAQVEAAWGRALAPNDVIIYSSVILFANSNSSMIALSFSNSDGSQAQFPLVVTFGGGSVLGRPGDRASLRLAPLALRRAAFRITGRQARRELQSIAFAAADAQTKAIVGVNRP